MGLPLRISDEIVRWAREEAETSDRSLTSQIEHWVRLGMAVEAVLGHGQVRELKRRGKALLSLPDALAYAESAEGQSEMRTHLETSGQPLYSADPERPGGIVRENPDGTRTRGKFVGRVFVPESPDTP
ncbi:ParD-like family protein [Stigmatella hybrida]|uniref:ParD-like family protein n=1 Tax=Stigmatella hybrida TaxID=394097 RepID=UPI001CDA9F4D|nr:ParD-like family protein [Stigmatella hybrida]